MVKKRAGADRLSGKIPAPLAVKYPETEFSRLQRAKIVEVDVAQSQHEEVWGIGRVTTLVPTEFRVKFYAQSERIWSAQEAQDEQKFVAACDGMVRAYKAMSSWAQAEGLQPVSQVRAIEAETHLGVMAIVKDEEDANQYLAIRKDVKQVWTVSEIAQLLNAGIGQAMAELKEKLPFRGAVVSVKQDSAARSADSAESFCNSAQNQEKAGGEAVGRGGASGFEDLENDLDVDAPSEMPKMFHMPDDVRKG
ncbi:hypothetical protein UFOVP751_41 [uncultured Caudovirales phage]|uniref:Uncharacterized protein n=1 Tax=uncultured Caudovirales phage TaxID=2100421 RepID=A0A6J7XN83_9CAUD|nr:hypothetical protein UFOVP751_41 [uncultured Caudovirales phage]